MDVQTLFHRTLPVEAGGPINFNFKKDSLLATSRAIFSARYNFSHGNPLKYHHTNDIGKVMKSGCNLMDKSS